MRLVCAILLAMYCVPAKAASAVTLVLEFDQAYSQKSLTVMKSEVASIVGACPSCWLKDVIPQC